MIIFGIRSRLVGGGEFSGGNCSHCGSFMFDTFCTVRYLHIFWIPLFPVSIACGTECRHCRKVNLGEDVDGNLRKAIRSSTLPRLKMAPYFSGALVLLALVVFGASLLVGESVKTRDYVSDPKVGDAYLIAGGNDAKGAGGRFSVMRVALMEGDSVVFGTGASRYDSLSEARKVMRSEAIDRNDFYSGKRFIATKAELKSLLDRHFIEWVVRR